MDLPDVPAGRLGDASRTNQAWSSVSAGRELGADMSELLGRRDCIESLRRDLVDLQGVTVDVFSRTGPVRVPSWKFPDQLSCHLDMVALLDQYDFVEGEDSFNQHAHVVLLELMIDRFLLLLHSLSVFVDPLGRGPDPARHTGCLSAGLVVRGYWTKLARFARVRSAPPTYALSNRTPSTPPQTATAHHSVSCQTTASSLVPCAACGGVQSTLRATAAALVDLFQSEGLPSSLQPFLAAVDDALEPGQMTAGDVAQWGGEQLRDMRRLAKHLQDVRGTVQPLQRRLAAAETELDRVRTQLDRDQKEFQQKTQKHQTTTAQLEFSLRNTQRSRKELQEKLLEEQQQHQRENLCLKEGSAALEEKLASQQQTLHALECEATALQERLRVSQRQEEVHHELQLRFRSLEAEASETRLRLHKEEVRCQSASRQQEAMEAKQQSLLETVDSLTEECEELQRMLGEREENETGLRHQVQQVSEEKARLQVQLSEQQGLCLELQEETAVLRAQVAELQASNRTLRDRERMLVAFPELWPQAQPQSTGSVTLDMEQQVKANRIRMEVLQQENAALETSLMKLQERARRHVSGEVLLLQTRSLRSAPAEDRDDGPGGAEQLGDATAGQEAGCGDGGVASSGPVTPTCPTRQLHIQTLHLGSTAAGRHAQPGRGSRPVCSNQSHK
ncbi:coiled-coil domain-containing protein 157 [Antennarius striatus]|uniref:coiled-coil domain-containing protein 157 n=1 Tax=Antennarius striatus TaxID=241820 RepID=UPI0035AF6F7F